MGLCLAENGIFPSLTAPEVGVTPTLFARFGTPLSFFLDIHHCTRKYHHFKKSSVFLKNDLYLSPPPIQVGDLDSNSCYQFTVTVSNSQGTGQSSAPSELACTLLPTPTTSAPTNSTQADPLTTPIIVGAVVFGLLFALVVVVVVILCFCCCLKLRRMQKYNLPDRR